jgi:lactate dehydrogenase-like 2-hydroxyacid dehydrogenase
MKPDLLSLWPMNRPEQEAQLEAAFVVHRLYEAADPAAMLADLADRVECVATTGGKGITAQIVAALPKLKIVSSFGVGYDMLDIEACRARGVAVTNTPDVLTDDVADMAVLLLLAARRRLRQSDAWVRSGSWGRAGEMPLTQGLSGKRVGIVGLGRIGKAIAARLVPFGVHLAYSGRQRQHEIGYEYYPDADSLAEHCDILIAAVAGGAGTRALISRRALAALGPQGTFVNIARGTVVDEAALIDLLQSGQLGSAGLDVYLNEPNPDPAFAALDTAVLTPHYASGTNETRNAMAQLVVDNLNAYLAGKPLLTPVT